MKFITLIAMLLISFQVNADWRDLLPGNNGIDLPGLPNFPGLPGSGQTDKAGQLTGVGAKKTEVTVSGLSAGAFMAVQMQVAFSKRVSGAVIIAGGLYYCAEGNVNQATGECMKGPQTVNATRTVGIMDRLAKDGVIDPVNHLKNDRVFLFSGKADNLVATSSVKELEKMYRKFLPASRVKTVYNIDAGHGVPTVNEGTVCRHQNYFNSPWILNCNYDAAGEMLKQFYGNLKAPVEQKSENLIAFDQREFGAVQGTSLGTTGHAYVPTSCAREKSCRVHVAFHGCDQDPVSARGAFVSKAGYNEWAESNNIVVLYPAAAKSFWNPQNPLGCFDWWGFTGSNYATKTGVQMQVVRAMLDRLAE